jgi:hypothetical protein
VFTDPLLRNRLHNSVVLLLRACTLRALPSNGRCLQSHRLATGLFSTIYFALVVMSELPFSPCASEYHSVSIDLIQVTAGKFWPRQHLRFSFNSRRLKNKICLLPGICLFPLQASKLRSAHGCFTICFIDSFFIPIPHVSKLKEFVSFGREAILDNSINIYIYCHDLVTIDGLWISECIYLPLIHTTRKYRHVQRYR